MTILISLHTYFYFQIIDNAKLTQGNISKHNCHKGDAFFSTLTTHPGVIAWGLILVQEEIHSNGIKSQSEGEGVTPH